MSSKDIERINALAGEWPKFTEKNKNRFVEIIKAYARSQIGSGFFVSELDNYIKAFRIFYGQGAEFDYSSNPSELSNKISSLLDVKRVPKHFAPVLYWLCYFHPEPAKAFFEEIGWQWRPLEEHPSLTRAKRSTVTSLGLELPTVPDDGSVQARMHFSSEATELIGRDDEIEMLRGFLEPDQDWVFKWLQISGAPGQGKSRLAYHLIEHELERPSEWEAGFVPVLDEEFIERVSSWIPDRDTLIVLDDAGLPGCADHILALMLHLRDVADKYAHLSGLRLRLIVLDRQPLGKKRDLLELKTIAELPSEWAHRVFHDPMPTVGFLGLREAAAHENGPELALAPMPEEQFEAIGISWLRNSVCGDNTKSLAANFNDLLAQFVRPTSEDNKYRAQQKLETTPLLAILYAEASSNAPDLNAGHIGFLGDLANDLLQYEKAKTLRQSKSKSYANSTLLKEHIYTSIVVLMAGSLDTKQAADAILRFQVIFKKEPQDLEIVSRFLGYTPFIEVGQRIKLLSRSNQWIAQRQFLEATSDLDDGTLRFLIQVAWQVGTEEAINFVSSLSERFPESYFVGAFERLLPADFNIYQQAAETAVTLAQNTDDVGYANYQLLRGMPRAFENEYIIAQRSLAGSWLVVASLRAKRYEEAIGIYQDIKGYLKKYEDEATGIMLARCANLIMESEPLFNGRKFNEIYEYYDDVASIKNIHSGLPYQEEWARACSHVISAALRTGRHDVAMQYFKILECINSNNECDDIKEIFETAISDLLVSKILESEKSDLMESIENSRSILDNSVK